ncbi:MAG TPA: DoxX family protein [Longimicrobiaceae bacterium]|nr:DoxX family protein [Longimicrobiaceae bacterium]
MLKRLIHTDDDLATFVIRVTLGLVVAAHGAQKLLGWFGGHGPAETTEMFQRAFGIPVALGWMVVLSDSLGALALVLGIFGRLAAAGTGLVMLGAIYFVHGRWGFFMNWYTQPRGEGFEFHLLALAMVIAILIRGSGRWSVDRVLTRRLEERDGLAARGAGDRSVGAAPVAPV